MLRWISKIRQSQKNVFKIKQMFFLMAFFLFLGLVVPHFVSAQTQNPSLGLSTLEPTLQLGKEDIRLTIAKIIRALLGLLGIIVLTLMIYAGYNIMTSAGNEQKIETGKNILKNATVGLAIILSSFAITQFIIGRLLDATGFRGLNGPGAGILAGNTFAGSGSLGKVVRDHYPFRDQTSVARNTKITISLNVPINPASVFVDSNANTILGDCIEPTGGATFSWDTHCDHLVSGSIRVSEKSTPNTLLNMAAMATRDSANEVTGIVLRPIQSLGNDTTNVRYLVVLTGSITGLGGTASIFANDSSGKYEWEFETGTEHDLSPPTVVSVYPSPGMKVARNTVLQINFSEAIDPVVAQGSTGSFYNMIFNDSTISGTWRITNAFRTVEFVSSEGCGENSCGQPMFCLPSICPVNDTVCGQDYAVLVSTAQLIATGFFEARPFTGIMDMAGNALNGNSNTVAEGKPPVGSATAIEAADEAPDNYYAWKFKVSNTIDRSAPYIIQVSPGIDMNNVVENAEHFIRFSKPMWMSTLDGISIMEHGAAQPRFFWMRPTAQTMSDGETKVSIDHRSYGPEDDSAYYFTSIPESVKSLNQNCVYPGYGPYSGSDNEGASPECRCTTDADTGILNCSADLDCVQVTRDSATGDAGTEDTGCVQNDSSADLLKGDVGLCINKLIDLSP